MASVGVTRGKVTRSGVTRELWQRGRRRALVRGEVAHVRGALRVQLAEPAGHVDAAPVRREVAGLPPVALGVDRAAVLLRRARVRRDVAGLPRVAVGVHAAAVVRRHALVDGRGCRLEVAALPRRAVRVRPALARVELAGVRLERAALPRLAGTGLPRTPVSSSISQRPGSARIDSSRPGIPASSRSASRRCSAPGAVRTRDRCSCSRTGNRGCRCTHRSRRRSARASRTSRPRSRARPRRARPRRPRPRPQRRSPPSSAARRDSRGRARSDRPARAGRRRGATERARGGGGPWRVLAGTGPTGRRLAPRCSGKMTGATDHIVAPAAAATPPATRSTLVAEPSRSTRRYPSRSDHARFELRYFSSSASDSCLPR